MTDLHMILLGVGVFLLLSLGYIIKLRRDYYREFIAGVPRRFYTQESRYPLSDRACGVND